MSEAADLPATRHGCRCNECHWCTWERDRVESIKMLLRGEIENALRLEGVKAPWLDALGRSVAVVFYKDSPANEHSCDALEQFEPGFIGATVPSI